MLGRKTEIRGAGRDRRCDIGAFALLDIDIDIRMLAQEAASAFGRCSDRPEVLASNMHAGATPLA